MINTQNNDAVSNKKVTFLYTHVLSIEYITVLIKILD
jgi:hypothetical protein